MDTRRRPSVTSRLSFAVSNAERGESLDQPAVAADQQIEEEIAEIKRYEVPSLPPPLARPSFVLNLANDAPRTSQQLVRTHRPSRRSHVPHTHAATQIGSRMLLRNDSAGKRAGSAPPAYMTAARSTGDTGSLSCTRLRRAGS